MFKLLASIPFVALGVFLLFLLFWKFVFLRDPERIVPKGKVIVSPADGKVISVLHWKKANLKLTKGLGALSVLCSDVSPGCLVVSIFMSPLDVHINRIPFDGKVLKVSHKPGSFRSANKLALENEKNEVLLNTEFGRIKVVQVAGFLARRIECWVSAGDIVKKGSRFGRINLGSQVVLVLPDNLKVKVRPKDQVKAGETIIATK
ncbi:MAG: phosphatidylserine decarboxylase [Candidatus Woesearchaeota archaeon]